VFTASINYVFLIRGCFDVKNLFLYIETASLKFSNMRNHIIGIALLLLSLQACRPTVDFALESEPSKLVIWGALHPDSVVSVALSKSVPPLSKNTERRISQASIVLFENNIAVDTLKEDSIGYYVSKKAFKPQVNKVYHITAAKEGFLTIKTPRDTMPSKPIILKAIFEDSARIQQTLNISRITLITTAPSHFDNYGFGRFRTTGYPWQSDTVQGGFFNNGGASPFSEDGNASCESNGFFSFLNYGVIEPSCKYSNTKYELYNSWIGNASYVNKVKFHFTICSFTRTSVGIMKALGKVAAQYGDYYSGLNIFWSPVTLPNYIENGYGFFGCYNTLDVTIPAR
jgi:hypothetical protein